VRNAIRCDCKGTGFKGSRCQTPVDPCESKPCRNGGKCVVRGNGFKCNCKNGFSGTRCEKKCKYLR